MFEQLSSLVWLHFTGNVIVLYLFKKRGTAKFTFPQNVTIPN